MGREMSGDEKAILYAGGFGASSSMPGRVGGIRLLGFCKLKDWRGVWGDNMPGGARVLVFEFSAASIGAKREQTWRHASKD